MMFGGQNPFFIVIGKVSVIRVLKSVQEKAVFFLGSVRLAKKCFAAFSGVPGFLKYPVLKVR
jgi:hypothetical protein